MVAVAPAATRPARPSRWRITDHRATSPRWQRKRASTTARWPRTRTSTPPPATADDVRFARAAGRGPHVIVSEDGVSTWRHGGRPLDGPGRPHVRSVTDGAGRIHVVTTDQHPADYANDVCHGVVVDGRLVLGWVGSRWRRVRPARGAASDQRRGPPDWSRPRLDHRPGRRRPRTAISPSSRCPPNRTACCRWRPALPAPTATTTAVTRHGVVRPLPRPHRPCGESRRALLHRPGRARPPRSARRVLSTVVHPDWPSARERHRRSPAPRAVRA